MKPIRLSAIIGLVCVGAACAGDGTGPAGDGGTNGVTLSGSVQPILTANCALSGCHAGANPQQGQNLSAGQTFANVVTVPSMELPTMNRVTPSDPDNSYLFHKIRGTHLTVGGSGSQMPLGGTPLSESNIDIIRQWIQAGALNN